MKNTDKTQPTCDLLVALTKDRLWLIQTTGRDHRAARSICWADRLGPSARQIATYTALTMEELPRRILFTVIGAVEYERIVEPVFDATDRFGRDRGLEFVWLPDLLSVTSVIREQSRRQSRGLRRVGELLRRIVT